MSLLLTEPQCVLVAGIWGEEVTHKKLFTDGIDRPWMTKNGKPILLVNVVHSWDGFGKTIEAVMMKLGRNHWQDNSIFFQAVSKVMVYASADCIGFNVDKCSRHIFVSTHLAALEVFKK